MNLLSIVILQLNMLEIQDFDLLYFLLYFLLRVNNHTK